MGLRRTILASDSFRRPIHTSVSFSSDPSDEFATRRRHMLQLAEEPRLPAHAMHVPKQTACCCEYELCGSALLMDGASFRRLANAVSELT